MDPNTLGDSQLTLELLAGTHPNGQPVFEQVMVSFKGEGQFQLLKSPMFVRDVARGDVIKPKADNSGEFEMVERSGQISVRVYVREDIEALERELTPAMEKLGGSGEIGNERALVYSIHFAVGFKAIEELLNRYIDGDKASWVYGNVYHPQTGEPLNWWQEMMSV